MPQLTLDTLIDQLFLIGPVYAHKLKRLNISSVEGLLHHYPFRYEDLSQAKIGIIVSSRNLYTRFGKTVQKIIVKTNDGNQEITYFNQPFLIKTLTLGTKIRFSGNDYEIIKEGQELIHTGRLVAIYPETVGVSSKWLRSRIHYLLKQIKIADWLPLDIQKKYCLIDLNSALHQLHFPKNQGQIDDAVKRLSFNEMFLLQLEALERKKTWQEKKLSYQFKIDQEKILNLISSLPFSLTSAQNRCLKEILADLNKDRPMNRLLQGEVGSGKTVLAAIAMFAAYLNGYQSVLMAPTEILANQHYQTLKTVFADTGIKIQLVTSSTKSPRSALRAPHILVGTHALLFRKISKQIGLLVIDEQHRFGVRQRSQILTENKITPHLLTMTATPIPRTFALTVYADLDLSLLDEMPIGRKTVKTWVVPPEKRLDAYHWIAKEITTNHTQAFIVCPLIDPSEKETMKDIKAVSLEFNQLKSVFNNLKLGLLHGRLKNKEKTKLLEKFKKNKINILVATPVIEVGIDFPNATIILIENAERFGLAQLHQLRGRVGRSQKDSYCLIFSQSQSAFTRLKYLETNFSGLKLAELDLKLRGPGDLYGLKQHGFFDLKFASLTETDLIERTKNAVSNLKNLTPLLKKELEKHKINSYATAA
ncbi:MAG: ATP-dependent DNA helicase RecG [Candidatus Beckwithbacteria bacterium]|nr:ATP-dependent DNA helicase RecG [Candidatus Beckwithbacteria bacterium]